MFKIKLKNIKVGKFIIEYHFYISFIIIFLYLSPYLIFWKSIPANVFDDLDSNHVYWKILLESGKIFADNQAIIPNMMSGLPRSSYGSEFSFFVLLFFIFPPFVAYVINEFLIHIFAFMGMYLLLKNHFKINHGELVNIIIIDGVSLCFAFLPFWAPGGLSIAGLPLALYAFLNLRFYKSTNRDWMVLTFIPFYSSFVFSYIFFITIVFLIFLKDYIINRNFNKKFFLALLYFVILYILIDYRLIISIFFNESYISHRSEFNRIEFSLYSSIYTAVNHFIFGQAHSQSIHTYLMIYSVAIAIVSYIKLKFFKIEDLEEIRSKVRLLFKMFTLSGAISVIYGFKSWEMLSVILNQYQILIEFQWDRFYTLFPLIWYMIFAISLDINFLFVKNLKVKEKSPFIIKNKIMLSFKIKKILGFLNKNTIRPFGIILTFLNCIIHKKPKKKGKNLVKKDFKRKIQFLGIFTVILIVFQGIYIISYNYTYLEICNKMMYSKEYVSYEGFYAENLFNEIKSDIKLPQQNYRIGCIGFEPAVALYNGFYTIDGYSPDYPLEYKHRFRYLISKELEKNPKDRKRFDDWGSRCYIFVAELGDDFSSMYKWKCKTIENLELNVTALKDLQVKFIFSSVKINNYYENNFILFNTYNNEVSVWKIYVYKVNI